MAEVTKLLSFLRKQAGNRIKRKDLEKAMLGKKGPARLDEQLILLSQLGLIVEKDRNIQISHPFTLSGRISFNKRGLAFVEAPGDRDVFVAPEYTGNALPGDRVEVVLHNRSRERFEGRVLRVLERERSYFRLKVTEAAGARRTAGILLDIRPPLMAWLTTVPSEFLKFVKKDQVLIVALTGEKKHAGYSEYQMARFIRLEEAEDDLERVLLKYGYDKEYPPVALEEQRDVDERSVSDWKERKDLRGLFTITIDGADAKDFDDAISLRKEKDGWELVVHIADVAYYVKQNSPLDQEARKRATSVYLPGMVLPMLPAALSEELCSLKAGVNRLAMSVRMTIRKDGTIKRYDFCRSIITVDQRLTYDGADEILNTGDGHLAEMLRDFQEMSRALKARRVAGGRIDLEIPEISFQKGPVPEKKVRLQSSIMIEEAMLSANTCVAEHLRKNKAAALYRTHAPMDLEKLELLNYFLKLHDIAPIVPENAASLQKALAKISERGNRESRIFQFLLLRSFMQAVYSQDPEGHWALALRDYCHFTSPIRRYPDLVCHRALAGLLRKKDRPAAEDLVNLGRHTSERERKAMDAERDAAKLFGLRYLSGVTDKKMQAILSGFKFDRLFFELENGLEAVVKSEELGGGELVGPDPFSVFIPGLARPAYLGEEWGLELMEVDFENMVALFRPDFKKIPRSTDWKG
ncbi:MAG: VacB/RNase II family 3'-5' exoribonuclease [Spirochaetales bacterium]|nr:VacB/RNase II family 3'-5' exoribonuclease [Spirochaetales bacterium]